MEACDAKSAPSLRAAGLATLAATLALIVWGMILWALLSGPLGTFRDRPILENAAALLAQQDTPTGPYFYPAPRDGEARASWEEAHTREPFFKISYVREGANPSSAAKLMLGSLHNLVVAGLAAALLLLAAPALPSLGQRFALVFIAGAMGSIFIQAGDPIWFHLPWDYAVGALVYEFVSWTLLAGVLGLMLRPRDSRIGLSESLPP